MSDKIYDFGYRLKELRERKNLSQGDLANLINRNPATISGYERNVVTPSLDILMDIVRVLDTTPNYLMGYEEENSLSFAGLTDRQKQFLIQVKDGLIEYDTGK